MLNISVWVAACGSVLVWWLVLRLCGQARSADRELDQFVEDEIDQFVEDETAYVEFDPGLAAIGAIEPEFTEELVGWAHEKVVGDWYPIEEFGSRIPVGWCEADATTRDSTTSLPYHLVRCEPQPIYRKQLRWRRS